LTVDWLLVYEQAMNGHVDDLTVDWLLMYGQAINGHVDVSLDVDVWTSLEWSRECFTGC